MLRKKVAPREVTVVFEPDGAGWHVYVREIQGCRSHGRSLSEARKNIREAVALCLDELDPPVRSLAQVVLTEQVRVPAAARKAVDRALRARAEAARKDAEAIQSAAASAKALRDAGFSLRDTGELLKLSHQRVKQLTSS